MTRLIHKDYFDKQYLTAEEARNLYHGVNKLGRKLLHETAHQMFVRSQTPLHKNWESEETFLVSCNVFCKLAKELTEEEFVGTIMSTRIPHQITFNKSQRIMMSNSQSYMREACMVLGFIDSMSDFFEHEVKLMELGYPIDTWKHSA